MAAVRGGGLFVSLHITRTGGGCGWEGGIFPKFTLGARHTRNPPADRPAPSDYSKRVISRAHWRSGGMPSGVASGSGFCLGGKGEERMYGMARLGGDFGGRAQCGRWVGLSGVLCAYF